MAPDDQLDLLSSLLTSLRNTKATFGEDSNQYRQMKAWVDEHISASASATPAASAQKNVSPAATNAAQQAASAPEVLPQHQHVFNLAFRPRPQGAGYAQ
ncbi:hypothetical protein GTA08_BOTSDO04971 [Neofusicoccum parvum]|uniref:Uncharacterized protein n=1 Tax=Neofusicoccum parvum TaxID=310453 RepID=A0ACB5RWM5_9PEZI|nr:hypothetical protein GTA08_BOTSDO04971 [Neofusicoccum parvum]GME66238.1 hypothetical protein GTA08_BOTSDO04971 [Neofusicoccum parvum]